MTMQVFVRGEYTMIAAPVQRDVDGIPKGSHYLTDRGAAGVSVWMIAYPGCVSRPMSGVRSAAAGRDSVWLSGAGGTAVHRHGRPLVVRLIRFVDEDRVDLRQIHEPSWIGVVTALADWCLQVGDDSLLR